MGVDLSTFDLDEPVGNVPSNAIQSVVANFAESAEHGREFTVRDIARHGAIGGLGPFIVGSGAQIADTLQEWVRDTDIDGFNLAYAITPGTFEDVVEFVIPELQARGVYPTEYDAGTLREKLHGRGARLPEEHRGARYRVGRATARAGVSTAGAADGSERVGDIAGGTDARATDSSSAEQVA
jgi:hypothetical protein